MLGRTLLCVLLVGTGSVSGAGCAIMKEGQELTRQSWEMMKPSGGDYRNTTEEETNEWDFVGKEGRGNEEPIKDPDRLWRQYIMSEKAREIERNLNIQ
jgi:hypothetical protein